jgi:hypothetical protein
VLLDSIIQKEIVSVFGVHPLLEYITSVLELDGITDETLKSGDFVRDIQVQINALPNRPDLLKRNAEFTAKIEEKVDKIYKRYGPFVTLKVLEDSDGYGKYIDDLFAAISAENTLSGFNIQTEIANYNGAGTGFWGRKKKEKEQNLEELRGKIKSYFVNQGILSALKNLIDQRRRVVRDDIHHKYFVRITKMVEELTKMLKHITGVETTSESVQDGNSTIFSWNFDKVPYSDIHGRIDNLFVKKITVKASSGASPRIEYKRGRILLMENGQLKNELFFLPEEKSKRYTVKVESENETISNVVSIEEVLQLNGVNTREINFEDMVRKFLDNVKMTEAGDIFSLMLENFSSFIEMFTKESFKDLLVMYSPGWDFRIPLDQLDEKQKQKLFRNAIDEFKIFALPSLPVFSEKVLDQVGNEKFSARLEPDLGKEYQNIIKESRDKLISFTRPDQLITRNKIAMMIAVNFYFQYPLSWYIEIADCKKEYDAVIGTPLGIGLHLAEGPGEDWRQKLGDIA